ncbi:MAG: hypothetical protein HFF01_09505 [Erysipelotrichaceae bacterium]|nr:hypothetical protein [Erysipelotrichaceae bacterium]
MNDTTVTKGPAVYNGVEATGSIVIGGVFFFAGLSGRVGGYAMNGVSLISILKDWPASPKTRPEITVYPCPKKSDARGSTYNPNPMAGGRTFEYLNGTIKKAPPVTDKDKWYLRYLLKLSREQLEYANDLAKILIALSALVLSLPLGCAPGAINLAADVAMTYAEFAFECISEVAVGINSSRQIDSEIDYALCYHFVDGYNSSMWFDAYFNKEGKLVAKSKPIVFTN